MFFSLSPYWVSPLRHFATPPLRHFEMGDVPDLQSWTRVLRFTQWPSHNTSPHWPVRSVTGITCLHMPYCPHFSIICFFHFFFFIILSITSETLLSPINEITIMLYWHFLYSFQPDSTNLTPDSTTWYPYTFSY
jgi:hypothetical protein